MRMQIWMPIVHSLADPKVDNFFRFLMTVNFPLNQTTEVVETIIITETNINLHNENCGKVSAQAWHLVLVVK